MKAKNFIILKRLLLLFALVGLSSVAFGQRTISGTVTDENGDPLPFANVYVEGTTIGTTTDIDGDYTLKVPEGSTALVVSYTGFGDQTLQLGDSNSLSFTMSEGSVLDEVVVIGYGSVKKSDLTGAVSNLGEDDFNRGAITSPAQLLDSRASGVQIVAGNGAPGAATKINIRGTSSIRAGNDPLVVIDGIQLDNRNAQPGGDISSLGRQQGSDPFAFIDPNEIASIEVLKDASATAIYGSRGANGVILITTKKGRKGEPTLEYNVSQGFASILKRPNYLNADGYRSALQTEGLGNDNDLGDNVDALDEILQIGYTNSHSVSLGGGGSNYTYRAFGSLFDQSGIVINSGLKKYVGGLKSSFSFLDNERLTIDFGVTASNLQKETAPVSDNAGYEGSLIGAALQWNPTSPLTKDDGTYNQDIVENRNPLAMADYIRDNSATTRIISNVGATLRLVDGLNYKLNVGLDRAGGERRASANPTLNFNDIFGRGQAIVGNNTLSSTQLSHTLNFQKDINENFSLNLLGGYEYLVYRNRGTNIFVTDLATDVDLDYTDILQSALNMNQRVESFREPDIELQSYFGRGIFNIMDKYLLTATIRADGSSKFGENNKYGIFPSFAAAWNMSNEGFIPDAVDNMKLRVGWGVTGNQEFPAGAAQEYYEYENGALTQRNNPNPNLSWESSSQLNVGLDFAFMNYKVSGSLDYFNKQTNDLILFVPLAQPNPSADGRIYRNIEGTIYNSGVELSLNTRLVEKEGFSWGLGGNFTYLVNKVDGLGTSINTGEINGQGLTGAFAQKIQNGESLFAYFLPTYNGLNGEGLSVYDDGNGGETLIATVNSVKSFVGDPLPDVLLGVNTDFSFGDFDLTLNFNGMFGYQVYNNTANAVFVKGNLANGRNILADQVDNGESTNNSYPASTRYLENGDHFRLSNATLGYTLGDLPGLLKGARLTLTGQNLLLLTGYSGFDPVVNTNKSIGGIPSFGIEYTPYPTPRTFLIGLNIKL